MLELHQNALQPVTELEDEFLKMRMSLGGMVREEFCLSFSLEGYAFVSGMHVYYYS
jgi:hypothetical protein